MPEKLLIATRNSNKKRELQEILSNIDIEVITLNEVKSIPEIVEDGKTFEENAIKKAMVTASLTGLITLADDSGLLVDALDGMPGIYSARFAGEDANDQKNNEKLLHLLEQVDEPYRSARFKCVIAICSPEGTRETVEGSCEGRIALKPSGTGGFGYDPLFIPEGFTKSFAELLPQEKNIISHRGKALVKAKPIIERFFHKGVE